MVTSISSDSDFGFESRTLSEFLDMGGTELRAALITQVRQDLDRCRDVLLTTLACPEPERDITKLCKTAHEIKGVAATIGAIQLADLARQVEQACQSHDHAVLADLMPRLAREDAGISTALANMLSQN